VSVNRRSRLQPRLLAVGIALVVAGLPLSACKEVEEESAAGYEPAALSEAPGSNADDVKLVTFTKEGAARVDLKTAKVTRSGKDTVIPYEALIYDDEGKTLVYTSEKPRTFLRESVTVDRIEGDRVLVSKGPSAGTSVVTRGATEVYGTELEIAGSH
jgi:hypothetical protein